MNLPTFNLEQQQWQQGYKWVAGVDEVGRGPLAGPVVTAAVIFDQTHQPLVGVKDSKMVTVKNRQSLSIQIKEQAIAWAISLNTVEDINNFGIAVAIRRAMVSAIQQLPQCDHVWIDGLAIRDFPTNPPTSFIVKGDQLSYSIAAASIIAKVYRDQMMTELAKEYPEYGWERNMGYGTLEHRQAIQKYGPTPHHRSLFIRSII